MKAILLIFCSCVISFNIFCQNGILDITVESYNLEFDDEIKGRIDLTLNGVIKETISINDSYSNSVIEGLEPGKYSIEIYFNDINYMVNNNVIIKENATTKVEINVPNYEISDEPDSSENILYSQIGIPLGLGIRTIEETPYPINRELSFGYEINTVIPVSKHFGVVNRFSTEFRFYKVDKDINLVAVPNDSERFFNWTLSEGIFFRLSASNLKTAPQTGWFVDMGVNYNLPLMFRYIYKENATKTSTGEIHKFNDVSVMLKLGYLPFSFFAEYNLLDFVKSPYPQMPHFRFGICLLVPTYE